MIPKHPTRQPKKTRGVALNALFFASVFFVLWKFFLINTLWHDRTIAPEPDDSYEYIANIASVSTCTAGLTCPYPGVSFSDHSGFSYLSYRMFFGLMGRAINLSPESAYHAVFFIGTLLLIPVLIFFLKSLTNNSRKTAWALFFLAFYHGTGETHGFFWVVPSFFSALLFFLLFSLITHRRPFPYALSAILSLTYAFVHPISIYLIGIIPLFFIFLYIFSGVIDKEALKRSCFVIFVVVVAACFQALYLNRLSETNYYGIDESTKNVGRFIQQLLPSKSDTTNVPREKAEKTTEYQLTRTSYQSIARQRVASLNLVYFRYILPHWTFAIPMFFAFLVLFWKREFKILSLYFASLSFFILATLFNEFGFRSAIILWPVTFVVFASASWWLIISFGTLKNPFIRRIFQGALLIFVALFLALNAFLSFIFNTNMNARYNYVLDERFSSYLLQRMNPNDTVKLTPILVRTTAGAHLYFSERVASPSDTPNYVVTLDSSGRTSQVDTRDTVACSMARRLSQALGIPMSSPTRNRSPKIMQGYEFDKEFGDITIYRKTTL